MSAGIVTPCVTADTSEWIGRILATTFSGGSDFAGATMLDINNKLAPSTLLMVVLSQD